MRNRTAKKTDFTMTQCTKGGVKIRESSNSYSADPFDGLNPFKNTEEKQFTGTNYDRTAYNMLDLNMGSTNQVHKLNVTFAYRRWFSESEFLNRLSFDPASSGIDDRPTAAFNSNELNF